MPHPVWYRQHLLMDQQQEIIASIGTSCEGFVQAFSWFDNNNDFSILLLMRYFFLSTHPGNGVPELAGHAAQHARIQVGRQMVYVPVQARHLYKWQQYMNN